MANPFPAALQLIVDARLALLDAFAAIELAYPNPPLVGDSEWQDMWSVVADAFATLYDVVVCDLLGHPNNYYSLICDPLYLGNATLLAVGQLAYWTTNTTLSLLASTAPGALVVIGLDNYQNCKNNMILFIDAYITGGETAVTPEGFATNLNVYVTFPLPLGLACFNEGTQILCCKNGVDTYMPIECMRVGTMVKTLGSYSQVEKIGKRVCLNNPKHPKHCMYVMEKTGDMTDDLVVTGAHSILVDEISDEERFLLKEMDFVQMLDGKYLLLAAASNKFKKIEEVKEFTCYHFVLKTDDNDVNKRFGVYANGVLTESISSKVYDIVGFEPLVC